jgi:hypothetical protein
MSASDFVAVIDGFLQESAAALLAECGETVREECAA